MKFTRNNPANPDFNVVLDNVFYFLTSIYGIWNLDIFRMLYKPFKQSSVMHLHGCFSTDVASLSIL